MSSCVYSLCLQPPVDDAFCIQRSIVILEPFGLGDNRQFKVAQQLLSLSLSHTLFPISPYFPLWLPW